MDDFEHGDVRIAYETTGAGDPVLLLPGWGGSIEELASLRAALEPEFRVIAADLPGSGRSGPQPRTYRASYLHDDTEVFIALLDAIAGSPAHLVGFSDGGEIALLVGALRPDAVRTIATWGAAGCLPDAPGLAEAFGRLIDDPVPPLVDFSAYMKAAYGASTARIMAQSAAAAQLAIMSAGGDISRSRAGDIACRALLITGEHDVLATPALVADMARAIPRGEFVEVAGAGHAVHRDQPARLNALIAAWLMDPASSRPAAT